MTYCSNLVLCLKVYFLIQPPTECTPRQRWRGNGIQLIDSGWLHIRASRYRIVVLGSDFSLTVAYQTELHLSERCKECGACYADRGRNWRSLPFLVSRSVPGNTSQSQKVINIHLLSRRPIQTSWEATFFPFNSLFKSVHQRWSGSAALRWPLRSGSDQWF